MSCANIPCCIKHWGTLTRIFRHRRTLRLLSNLASTPQSFALSPKLSKTCKNSRMVFAYVSGGKLEDYNEYYIGNRFDREYKNVNNKPVVLYSLTIEDCEKGEYEVFDWFFGDDKPITITEASPYLR